MKAFIYIWILVIIFVNLIPFSLLAKNTSLNYPIVDTGQEKCYNNSQTITKPQLGASFYG